MAARAKRWIVLAAVAAAGVAALAALVAAFAPLPSDSREAVYVIPSGTAAKRSPDAAGATPLPSRIRMTLGVRDVLVLRNEGTVEQSFGPVLLAPGQTYRVPFHDAAEFQLACSAHADGQVTVTVEPAPSPGWARLLWRAHSVLDRLTGR